MLIVLIIAALFGLLGYKINLSKGREPWIGAVVGFLLGLLGVIVLALWPRRKS